MIHPDTLTEYIQAACADAKVEVVDRTGTLDHLQVTITSTAFEGQNLLNRQRMVYKALSDPMKDGRIHALELKLKTPDEA